MQNAAATIALQSGIIDALPSEGSISATDLASKTGADEALIGMYPDTVLQPSSQST